MLIAVTGGTGFIGRYIVNRLLEGGHTCRCWYRPESDRGGFVGAASERLQWVEGRLGDEDAGERLVQGAEALVHGALEWERGSFVGREGDLLSFAQANVMGSLRLFEAARRAKVKRVVFISTCAVHDRILSDRALDEAHPLWPHSHYGAHKAAIEKFIHAYGLGGGWAICALRPTGVYGLRRPVEASKWYRLVRQVVEGRRVSSAAGGKEVHAADVAKATELLINAPAERVAGESFNCYDLYVADQDVAQIAKRLSGSKAEIELLNKGPKNQIQTGKIRALGMKFGGPGLLEKTVGELVEAGK